jgi:hypothetical protein
VLNTIRYRYFPRAVKITDLYGTPLPRRNWHPFGKILVSDVPEAFALNSRLQLTSTTHVYNCLQRLTTSYPEFPTWGLQPLKLHQDKLIN